jgi:hypothetical protein
MTGLPAVGGKNNYGNYASADTDARAKIVTCEVRKYLNRNEASTNLPILKHETWRRSTHPEDQFYHGPT